MATGIVKSFDLSQGFGFITPDDGSPDIRVDLAAAEKAGLFTLIEGEHVRYSVIDIKNEQLPLASKLMVKPG